MTNSYPIARFVADLRAIVAQTPDESAILEQVTPLAKRAALAPDWRTEELFRIDQAQGSKATTLSEEPDHTLLVVAASWLPGRGAPPHDHGTWAVVVGVEGTERNIFWERLDDRSRPGYAEVRRSGSTLCGSGDVVKMRTGTIHSIVNEGSHTSLSFHVYGRHFNHTARSQYDPDSKSESPLKISMR